MRNSKKKTSADFLRSVEILADSMNDPVKSRDDFAFEYDVSPATISRDIESINELGLELFSRKKHLQIFSEPNTQILNPLLAEYLALKLNREIFENNLQTYGKRNESIYFQYLVLLAKAVIEHRYIKISYQRLRDNELHRYELKPVRLITSDYNWVIHAYEPNQDLLKTFYVNRIRKLDLSSKLFRPLTVKTTKEIQYELVLRFNPSVSREISDKIWFDEFELEYDSEGYVILKTKQPITNKLAAWCVSWWDKLEIIDPVELKEQIKEMVVIFGNVNKL